MPPDVFSRRELIGTALAGSALAQPGRSDERQKRRIIDTHIHLWKLPRSRPPMDDDATFPEGCCAAMPWLLRDRLIPDYDARVGGRKVDHVVLIESSVSVPSAKILQSNRWMLNTAEAESKILSVIGHIDVTQDAASFLQQVTRLSADKKWVGIRIGGTIFQEQAAQTFSSLKPNVMANLASLSKRGLQIDALGIPGSVLSRIGSQTGIAIVMDHFAGKPLTFEVEDSWKADMQAAATYPRLYIKVSDVHKLSMKAVTGSTSAVQQFQPVADPAKYAPTLEFLWKTFGQDRLTFGTNWPVSDSAGLFVDSIDLQIDILESFLATKSPGARDRVMFENASRVYRPRA